jgi:hypothetical protein
MARQRTTKSRVLAVCLFLVPPMAVSCRSGEPQSVSIDLTKLGVRNYPSQVAQIPLIPTQSIQSLPTSVSSRIPEMSNPGGRFEATDVGPSDAPRRRLIFGGVSDRYCLVHYEYGGIAHGYTTVLFAISGNQATALWAHAGGRYSDLKEFAKETNRDKLSNEVNGIIF